MGCGCGKKKKNGTVVGNRSNRSAVYQVYNAQGEVTSEHGTPAEARAAAVSSGGRVRITSRTAAPK